MGADGDGSGDDFSQQAGPESGEEIEVVGELENQEVAGFKAVGLEEEEGGGGFFVELAVGDKVSGCRFVDERDAVGFVFSVFQ